MSGKIFLEPKILPGKNPGNLKKISAVKNPHKKIMEPKILKKKIPGWNKNSSPKGSNRKKFEEKILRRKFPYPKFLWST